MKVIMLLIVGILNGFSLTKDEILKIAKMPHNRENLVKELQIYGEGREYEVEVTIMSPGKEPVTSPKVVVTEKTVEGKYIVTFIPMGEEGEMIMVVEYDKKENCYFKWILPPLEDAEVFRSVGTADKKSRSIAWSTIDSGAGLNGVTLEKRGDREVTWSEVHTIDGKVVQRVDGKAIKLK